MEVYAIRINLFSFIFLNAEIGQCQKCPFHHNNYHEA